MTIRAQQRGLTREVDYSQYLLKRNPSVDLKWGKGLSDIIEAFGLEGFLKSTLQGVTGVVQGLQTLLDLIEGVVEFLIVVIGRTAVDVAEALVLVLKEALERIINIFSGTSFHLMTHFPTTPKTKRSPSEVLYDVGTAYLDTQDDKRPRMVSDVFGAAVIGLWSVPNIDSLKRVKDQINSNLQGVGSDFGKLSDEFNFRFAGVGADWQNPITSEGHSGMAPDFDLRGSLTSFGPIKTMVDALSALVQGLKKGLGFGEKIREVLSLVQARLAELGRLVDEILNTIVAIGALFAFGDANAALLVEGVGREIDFSNAIINAPLDPNYPKSDVIENINNLFSTDGLENPIDRELGERNLFGGALLLHLQVPALNEEAVNGVKALVKGMFKEVKSVATSNEEAQAERLTTTNDRLASILLR